MDKTKSPSVNTNANNAGKNTNSTDKDRLPRGRPNLGSNLKRFKSPEISQITDLSSERGNQIDVTKKKHIKQATLLVGSSILKGVKTNELKSNTTVRSFSGATTVTLKENLDAYNLENLKLLFYTSAETMPMMAKTNRHSVMITFHC